MRDVVERLLKYAYSAEKRIQARSQHRIANPMRSVGIAVAEVISIQQGSLRNAKLKGPIVMWSVCIGIAKPQGGVATWGTGLLAQSR